MRNCLLVSEGEVGLAGQRNHYLSDISDAARLICDALSFVDAWRIMAQQFKCGLPFLPPTQITHVAISMSGATSARLSTMASEIEAKLLSGRLTAPQNFYESLRVVSAGHARYVREIGNIIGEHQFDSDIATNKLLRTLESLEDAKTAASELLRIALSYQNRVAIRMPRTGITS